MSWLDTGSVPEADRRFTRAVRIVLSEGAWLESVPGWLSGHAALFDQLQATADWERHGRNMYERYLEVPRLVAPCPGEAHGLGWRSEDVLERIPRRASQPEVRQVARLLQGLSVDLSTRYRRQLDRISLAYYRDGRDSVAFHGDRLGPLRADTVVAILSVGARRRFALRPARGTRGRARTFSVGEGDLLVLGGDCQETWEHAVPKAGAVGPRIAVMFREANEPDMAR